MPLKPPLVAGPRNPQQSPEGVAVNALRLVPLSVLPSVAEDGTLVALEATGEVYRRAGGIWVLVGSGGGGGGITGEYTNPDYPSLTTITSALDFLLEVPLAGTGMSVSPSTAEVGMTVTSFVLSWGWNKTPDAQSLSGTGSVSLLPADTTKNVGPVSVTANTSWTVSGTDGAASVNQSAGISFLRRRFWGPSANPLFVPSDLPSSDLSSSRGQSRSISCTGQYLCFAWPSSFGVPRFYVGGFLNTAWEERIAPFTNAYGHTEDYRMYRSTYIQNGQDIPVVVQ